MCESFRGRDPDQQPQGRIVSSQWLSPSELRNDRLRSLGSYFLALVLSVLASAGACWSQVEIIQQSDNPAELDCPINARTCFGGISDQDRRLARNAAESQAALELGQGGQFYAGVIREGSYSLNPSMRRRGVLSIIRDLIGEDPHPGVPLEPPARIRRPHARRRWIERQLSQRETRRRN